MEEKNETIVEKICNTRKSFEALISSHSDDAGFADSVQNALEESGLLSEEKIRKDYEKNAESERLLKIGIVGAVKAGKSSLLNSLFFEGTDILPKAATPMTAALTEMTWGEEYSVTVDFFTEADIAELEKKSAEYKRKFSEIKSRKAKEAEENWRRTEKRKNPNFAGNPDAKDRKQWETLADSGAKIELKKNLRLSGAYEQYQMIQESAVQRKSESEQFTVNSISEISGRLEDYVGAKGKYMPFTSKVSITLPLESLKGISIIDTPGFNDPVPSRDEWARQALRECDAIFILSKATPCLPAPDMEVISKITKKNGIREMYIVPSQVDSTLIAQEHIKYSGGDVDMALEKITEILSTVVSKNLRQINEGGVFDDLIKEPTSRMYLTSGICESMSRTFAERSDWDSGKKTVWNNLCRNYPDFFSDGDEDTSVSSLRKLGNIEKIRGCVDEVKARKAQIFKERLEAFGSKYTEAAKEAKELVLRDLEEREAEIQKRDIGQLEAEIQRLQQSYEEIAPELDDAFFETVSDWYNETKGDYESRLSDARGDVKNALKSHEGETTHEWTTGHLWWKEYHSKTLTTVNANAVKNSIADYIDDYNGELPHFLETEIHRLTKKVINNVIKVWTSNNTAPADSTTSLRNRVRSIMSEMNREYDLEYTGAQFSYDSYSSNLEGSSADECISQANGFVSELNRTFRAKLKAAMDDVYARCKSYPFSKNVLDAYIKRLEKAKSDIEKPKLALENFRRMRKEVEAIEW